MPEKLHRPALSALNSAHDLLTGMVYAMWRSMRGSPRYVHIADSNIYWLTNVVLVSLTGVLVFWTGQDFEFAIMFGLLRSLLLVPFALKIAGGANVSRVAAGSILGCVAGFDLIQSVAAIVMQALELESSFLDGLLSFGIIVLMTVAIRTVVKNFKRLPDQIKKAGYHPLSKTLEDGKEP